MTLISLLYNRLWIKNSSLVQLLGLCPVLAMTTNIIDSLGLGIVTTIVLTITNTIVSIFKSCIPKDVRIPIYMIIISSIVTSIELFLHAYEFRLYQSLGVFIPLIVTNCIILARADFIAYKNSVYISFFDGLFIGLGSTISMCVIGLVREVLGNGTLFFGAHKIFTALDSHCFITLFDKNFAFILAILPPGGFMILGLIIACKNMIDISFNRSLIKKTNQCICFKKSINNE